jgi:glutamate 5-kinase
MATYAEHLRTAHGIACGQVLLVPHDFFERDQYLHARSTLARLLELGVLPIVNENDTVADHEIRFGDNDRIAALVAQSLQADLLVLLTDTDGLLTADPRLDANASLITDIIEFDREIEAMAKGSGSNRGSGGMASKIAAAKMASWAGVRTVIASAARPSVMADAIRLTPGVGTVVHPRKGGIPARKIWIAFAVGAAGTVTVDDGAKRALLHRGGSLLAAGVQSVKGAFEAGDAVEVADTSGAVFAKGLAHVDSATADRDRGRRSDETGAARSAVVVHRDDLVILE